MLIRKKILVLDADTQQNQKLCSLLEAQQYRSIAIDSLGELEICMRNEDCLVTIIDLDTFPVDNRTVRDLTVKYPGTYFLCISSDRFHPHLKEALCYHIYACINKPVDMEELFFWLRSIYENESDQNDQPED